MHPQRDDVVATWLRAGALTALTDGLFSSVLSVMFYGSTATRLFQGVASTAIGPKAIEGGTATAMLGVLMHVSVAFFWSAVFVFVVARAPWVRRLLASSYGAARVASVYGPAIWMVMSLAVIPVLLHRPPSITVRWWVQFFGHIPFVGLPIAWSYGRAGRRDTIIGRS